jgi:hypothetical protein
MKITDFGRTPPWTEAVKPDAAAKAPGARFAAVFKQALEGGASAEAASAAGPDTSGDAACRQVEGFLDLLDRFRRSLADPSLSLRGMEPVVREMESGRDQLQRIQAMLPEGDGLKEICNRAAVAATVEIVRFRRGDYLAA